MATRNVPEGDIISVPVDAPMVEQFVENAVKNSKSFSEDEVENIRKQEKDKMYKRLEEADTRVKSMEEQLTTIAQERETAQKEASDRAAKEAELIRERETAELSAKELLLKREDEFNLKLSQIEQDYKNRFDEIEAQRSAQEALLEKERQMQAINSYRQRRLNDEQETIIPELIDLIAGNSEEEIEN